MSKKLIAVASAAALALSALVAVPAIASAGPFSATLLGQKSGTGITATGAIVVNVPSQNVQRFHGSELANTTGTLVRITVQTTVAGAGVDFVASGATKLLSNTDGTTNLATMNATSGASTLSATSDASADAIVFAYTTSTAAQTIVATQQGTTNSLTIHIKGLSAKTNGYKLSFAPAATTTSPSGKIKFTGTVVDMFGNTMGSIVEADITDTGIGGSLSSPAISGFAQNATTGVITFDLTNRDTAGNGAYQLTLASTALATEVAAFGDQTSIQFFALVAADLTAQVTALTAQVAALQASMADMRTKARSVSKKKYNTLARKWNAANPGARVTLK